MALRRSLVIVGINYAPEQTGIGPYTAGLAKHMASQGWKVTVATGMPHYPQWRVDPSYRWKARVTETSGGVDLQRLRHFVPSHQSLLGRGMYEATFSLHAGLRQKALPTPDCVIGVIPSLGGGAAAARLAKRWHVPLGVIFQDLVGQAAAQSGLPGGGKAASSVRAVESWIARRADGVGIVAEAFRPYLEAIHVPAERITHLPNWSHVAPPNGCGFDIRSKFGWAESEFVILHAGNMGYKQDLGNLLTAARQAQTQRLPFRFVFMGDGAQRRELEHLAEDLLNVQFLDPQPEELFMNVLAAADVLVLNERVTVVDMSLPSKITSYFRSGRPVVAAVSLQGSTARELTKSGGALIVAAGDPVGLLDAIQAIDRDRTLGYRLAHEAKTHADSHFSQTPSLKRWEHFIIRLLGA